MKRLSGLFLILSLGFSALGQTRDPDSHFIVIGTFRTQENASRFTSTVNQIGFNAQYAINPAADLYYVFLLETSEKDQAQKMLTNIKEKTRFKNAWVFTGKLGYSREDLSPAELTELSVRPPKIQLSENKPEAVNSISPNVKPIYFKVLSNDDGRELVGNLLLKETGDVLDCRWINSGEVVYVLPPRNENGSYTVAALIPGYKERALTFFYENPSVEKGDNNEDIITLSLDKARGDDFIDFNNVRFIINSAFLRPVSKNELDELVILLNKDKRSNIIIHGHCDGRPENLEAMDSDEIKKEVVASEALARARAEAVKSYLILQGIDESRIHTKGERMPLPQDAVEGKYKNTVEVEFVMAL